MGQIDDIEIAGENFLLGHAFFEIECPQDLLKLTFDADLVIAGYIFDQLLGYGGGAKSIVKAQKAGKNTAEAEKLLADLSASFDCGKFLKESVFFNSNWSEKFEKDGKRYASGVLNLPNGWNLDDYDKNRAKIAEAIIALQR